MVRTNRIKLGRAPKQEAKLRYVLMLLRHLYNAALQQRIEAWQRQRVSLGFFDQCKQLTQLRAEMPEYRALPAIMTRMTVLQRLDLAFNLGFRSVSAVGTAAHGNDKTANV